MQGEKRNIQSGGSVSFIMQNATTYSDEQLAELAQQGKEEAFGALVDRYTPKILRYGQKFLFQYEDVEDAVQETFVKAYLNIQSFQPSRKFSSWMYRIAHNTFISLIRKKKREPLEFFDFDTVLPLGERWHRKEKENQEGDKELVQTSLEKLSPKYREVLVLVYKEEQSYQAISDILQIPVSTVGVRINRAKALLKKEIQQQEAREKI